jgi:excisionase family DNA binding protein
MHRRIQSGMRENPASTRRHGPRQAVSSPSDPSLVEEKAATSPPLTRGPSHSFADADSKPNAASPRAATGGGNRDDGRLLTVHEVAELLRVPSSWVYERTRRRCLNCIPGIRLGKYWRFQRTDIMRWIDANRKKDYPHAG